MQYLGSKKRIAKDIVVFLHQFQSETKYYFEPFVGSAVIVAGITGKRFASDKNEYLIEMYKALQQGWLPPQNLSEEQYNYVKDHKEEDRALTGFVGIGCSYSGKWFGGYARNNKGYNYCLGAYNSLMKQLDLIKEVTFKAIDYRECHPKNALVYCDPPYIGTTGYDAIGDFNSEEFWEMMKKWSVNNKVFISEYKAPEDFKCVWEIDLKTNITNRDNKIETRKERIFQYLN